MQTKVTHTHYETFRNVISLGGFTKAAKSLRTSQPTVSRVIAELQQHVGFKLFTKIDRRLMPTTEALALFDIVERSFVGLDTIQRETEAIANKDSGHLRVLSMPALAHSFLPKVINVFLQKHPGISVSLDVQRSETISGWASTDYFDIGFAMLPIERQGLDIEIFSDAEMVCVMRYDHVLATNAVITAADLDGIAFISGGEKTFGPAQKAIEDATEQAGIRYLTRVETPISAVACELVAHGVGVALVDPFTASSFADVGVISRPFNPTIVHQFGMVFPRNLVRSEICREFVNIANDVKASTLHTAQS